MKYSKFNEHLGLYEVFEDAKTHPLNADLPVPSLSKAANGIGVAARNAGRPLPSQARRIGTSFHPVGLVVASDPRGGLGSLTETAKAHPWWTLLGVAAVGAGLYYAWERYLGTMEEPWGAV